MNQLALPHSPIGLEGRACAALITLAPFDGDCSEANNLRARRLCAAALRAWRKLGDRQRAKWFRSHVYMVGYPLPLRWFKYQASHLP